ncbi:MAG TPA: type II toxin-antitoxin system VapC family toxin [Rhizomicrobium sp.]|jgi:ribonuclease VapC|nr:type II toxin-antitoxin system VapC family toxin [Rhizomicrobium sp.]
MFVDASAIVAILTGEPEANRFSDLLESATRRLTSPIALFEATLGICRKRHATVVEAEADVQEFLGIATIDCVSITAEDSHAALVAFARYGKGTCHPAQLNLGDCFAYALARNRNLPLLFKGDDFARTDIEIAA